MKTEQELDLKIETLYKHASTHAAGPDFKTVILERIELRQIELLKSMVDGILNGLTTSELEYLKKGINNGKQVDSSQQDILDQRSDGTSPAHSSGKRTRRRQPRAPSGSVLGS